MQLVKNIYLRLHKIITFLSSANRIFIAGLMGALFVLVFISVILRYVFNSPLAWSDEVSKLTMVWMAFMGASLGLWEKEHIAIELLVDKFPPYIQSPVRLAGYLIIIIFLFFLTWFGIRFTEIAGPRVLIPLTNVPMTYIFMVIPACAILMIMYQLTQIMGETIILISLLKGNTTKGIGEE